MRAFTSLAGHIIGSHPEVNGYYEMHISYDEPQAPAKQLKHYLENDELKAGSRYLFDKLLHNEYRLELDRLDIGRPILLIALREPLRSIRSIVSLFMQKDGDEPYASPVEAAKYYIDRVAELADYCGSLNQGYYYFDADVLCDAPDVLLPSMTRWLELGAPLRASYSVFKQTGRQRTGDSSELIRSGKIVKTVRDYADITIPEPLQEAACEAYHDCRRRILGGADDSVTGTG